MIGVNTNAKKGIGLGPYDPLGPKTFQGDHSGFEKQRHDFGLRAVLKSLVVGHGYRNDVAGWGCSGFPP